jgi:putative resolvase
MKLKEWARQEGVNYRTAVDWFHAGRLPVRATQSISGTITIDPPTAYIYARVDNEDQDIQHQIDTVDVFCKVNKWDYNLVIEDVAPNTDESRAGLDKLLSLKDARVVVLKGEVLAHSGVTYIEKCITNNGGQLIIMG